jgi:hypothetical protein
VETEIPVACSLTDAAFRARRDAVQRDLFSGRRSWAPEPDGYRFRFPPDDVWLERITEFVLAERQCCPFLTFRVVVHAGETGVDLELSGPPGSRTFIERTFLGTGETP